MKAFKNKALSLILVTALAASMLAGCGNKDGDTDGGSSGKSGKGGKGTVAAVDSSASKEGVWKGEKMDLGIDGDFNIQKTFVKGDQVSMLIQNYNYTENGYSTQYYLVTMNRDGSNVNKVPLEGTLYEQTYDYKDDEEPIEEGDGEMHILEEDTEAVEPTEAPVGALQNSEGGMIVPVSELGEEEEGKEVTYRSVSELGLTPDGGAIGVIYEEILLDPMTYEYETNNCLTAWGADGSIIWSKPFAESDGTYVWIQEGTVLSNGNYFLIYQKDDKKVGEVYDTQGNMLKQADMSSAAFDSLTSVLVTPDGKDMLVYYIYNEQDYSEQYKTALLDPDTLDVTDDRDVLVNLGTNGLYSVCSGAGLDIVYMTNAGIFGFNRNDT